MLMLIFFAVIMLYLGKALGYLHLTYSVPSLRYTRKLYLYMPFITFWMIFGYILQLLKQRKHSEIIPFIFMSNKMAITGLAFVEVAYEYARKHPEVKVQQVLIRIKFIPRKEILKTYTGYAAACAA